MSDALGVLSIGLLSECSTSVRVQGQVLGASITVTAARGADRSVISTGVADSGDQVFALADGVTLRANDAVTATQTLDGQISEYPDDLAVFVQPVPDPIGNVTLLSHLWECTKLIVFGGMVPGGHVSVRDTASGTVLGSGDAPEGNAIVLLDAPVATGAQLEAQQSAAGRSGDWTPLPVPEVPPNLPNQQLQFPVLNFPLYQCDRSVTVLSQLEGAVVEVIRGGNRPNVQFLANAPDNLAFIDPPLDSTDALQVSQAFADCGWTSPVNTPDPYQPLPTADVPPPTITTPICPGSRLIPVTGMRPGSQIKIDQEGTILGTWTAPAADFAFTVARPLDASVMIDAQEQVCDGWIIGPTVPVAGSASADTPTVPGPLWACATVVRVEGVRPGATVWLMSQTLGPISRRMIAGDTSIDITVSPALRAGDTISAQQTGCGGPATSSPVVVGVLQNLPAPTVSGPIIETLQLTVTVTDVVPGAIVELYADDRFVGRTTTGGTTVTMSKDNRELTGGPAGWGTETEPFLFGENISAQQRLCALVSPRSSTVAVSHIPYPCPPTLLSPPDGATDVDPHAVTFAWQDGCPGTLESASRFLLSLQRADGVGVWSDPRLPPGVTTDTVPFALAPATAYRWSVGGQNVIMGAPLFGGASSRSFTTARTPPPPVPVRSITLNLNAFAADPIDLIQVTGVDITTTNQWVLQRVGGMTVMAPLGVATLPGSTSSFTSTFTPTERGFPAQAAGTMWTAQLWLTVQYTVEGSPTETLLLSDVTPFLWPGHGGSLNGRVDITPGTGAGGDAPSLTVEIQPVVS